MFVGLEKDFQLAEDEEEAGRNVSINFVLNLTQATSSSSQERRKVVASPQ